MKKCIKFSGRWLLLGVLIIVAYLSGINPAKAAYHVLSSQYAPALKLLKETQNETGKKSNQCRSYLRKKRKYSRFLDAYIKDKRKELSPEWKKRVGAYRIINPDSYSSSMIPLGTNVSIQEQPPGVLHRSFLHGNRPLSSVIDPIFNDQAVKTGLGRNVNETIQVVDCGGEECLYHLGYLYKKQPK